MSAGMIVLGAGIVLLLASIVATVLFAVGKRRKKAALEGLDTDWLSKPLVVEKAWKSRLRSSWNWEINI